MRRNSEERERQMQQHVIELEKGLGRERDEKNAAVKRYLKEEKEREKLLRVMNVNQQKETQADGTCSSKESGASGKDEVGAFQKSFDPSKAEPGSMAAIVGATETVLKGLWNDVGMAEADQKTQ